VATLCHDDLHHNNVLFRPDGGDWRLAAVLDWDKAWAGSAESEVARMAFWDDMTGPGFWEVYRASVFPSEAAAERALIYQLLWCLEYDDGSQRHVADTARLRRRLAIPKATPPVRRIGPRLWRRAPSSRTGSRRPVLRGAATGSIGFEPHRWEGTVESVTIESGSRLTFRWRASWLAVGVLAVAGVFAAATRIPSASHGSASAMPFVSVMTAPMSTAATPSVPSVGPSLLAPSPGTSAVTTLCQEPVLRVLQFNIRAGRNDAGGVDIAQIAAEIQAVHPDLVSLNEVDSQTRRTRVDEPAYLAEATGLHGVYGPNLIYDGGPYGNAILTRYPVVESHNLMLPGTYGLERRGLLTAIVSVDGRRVAFSSTHLSEGSDGRHSRLLQALAVAEALHSMATPTILAGDLNSEPTDGPERILRGHLLDAQEQGGTGPGDTFPEANPNSRFDYVLYDDHFAVVPGSTRVQTSNSSDHRSVFTKLTLLLKHPC
jgi:endonuclease/exonuclease/phosphatase family metal-dependent hydrolase